MAKKKSRKVRAVAKPRLKAKAIKNSKSAKSLTRGSESLASRNRSEGLRLFKIAGRPTKEQFILVYGENGPKMTWTERAAAGVPANEEVYTKKIQTLLCSVANPVIMTALGISVAYAVAIRAGLSRPHPRHWQGLAQLVGVSADA